MAVTTTFHGTDDEKFALAVAIDHHCTCDFDAESGMRTSCCPPHHMLVSDQRALNGLLWARHQVARLLSEEMADSTPIEHLAAYRMHVRPGPEGATP